MAFAFIFGVLEFAVLRTSPPLKKKKYKKKSLRDLAIIIVLFNAFKFLMILVIPIVRFHIVKSPVILVILIVSLYIIIGAPTLRLSLPTHPRPYYSRSSHTSCSSHHRS